VNKKDVIVNNLTNEVARKQSGAVGADESGDNKEVPIKSGGSENNISRDNRLAEKVVRWMKSSGEEDKRGYSERIMVVEDEVERISYNKLQGRPSIVVEIEGVEMECLLDTGAAMNVIAAERARSFKTATMYSTTQKLTAANGSLMNVVGEVMVLCKVGKSIKRVNFVVVENLRPQMIGGVPLQRSFGIGLRWLSDTEKEEFHRVHQIYELEAKFGVLINDEQRLKEIKKYVDMNGKRELEELVMKFKTIFMANEWDIGKTNLITHEIKTSCKPINIKPRRQPEHLQKKLEEAIKNLEDNGIIRRCNSPWNTPLVCVWKKDTDSIRICMDFRQLNQVSERQAFPMPNMEELMDKLHGTQYFSTIDLGNAYYQVELEKESQLKTAFSTKSGQFCFQRMPFGIAAAPGTFQELMMRVLAPIDRGTSVYLDDILIATRTKQEHYEVLNRVFQQIAAAGLKVKPAKCKFLREEVKFLGHVVNKDGIRTDPDKIKAIADFQRPNCIKRIRSFLGICNYYRRFILEYSKKAKILEGLCGSKKDKLIWTDECEQAFNDLKEALVSAPVLKFPDFGKSFILDTDASFDSIGAVLSQVGESGKEQVIAYGSHSMGDHEKGYCITRKELLAVYYFCQHFNHYLYGKRFKLRTDHKAITFMVNTKKPITAQFQTWINYLSSLDIEMVYRKGKLHANADMLSRSKCDTCIQCQMAHEEPKTGKLKTRLLTVTTRSQAREIQKEWISKPKRRELIIQTHRLLCHAGAEKVYHYLKDKVDMEEEHKMVKEVVSECVECQQTKTYTAKTKEDTIKINASELFEKVYIDICGPWKETIRKEKYILAMIDHWSKYIILTAIKRQDEQSVAETILKKWILKFGAPKEIHADCGKNFESQRIKELMEKFGIQLIFSSPYHHNTNGMVERQFRTIREYIHASTKERGETSWADILPEVEFALNATRQKTIGKSPTEMLFGRKIDRQKWYSRDGSSTEARREVEGTITQRAFQLGDKVLVKKEIRNKSDDKYDGPFKVVEKIHERSYRLEDSNKKQIIRNVEKLKIFKERGDVRE